MGDVTATSAVVWVRRAGDGQVTVDYGPLGTPPGERASFHVADVHHAEVIRHRPAPGFALHELIAGPLSASRGRPRPLDEGLNPRSLAGRGGVNNFGEIVVGPKGLSVPVIDDAGTVLFTRAILAE